MDLSAYLARVGFDATPRVDYATLAAIHHGHLLNIPYENVDVQSGTPLDFDQQRIFHKLVNAGRGGWCYEMNGLLGWALAQIGFEVRRMSGAVMRETLGDAQLGNHLVLEVMLDETPYLVDVGLGDGLRYPIPIEPGVHEQGGLEYRLEPLADGYWRFHNHRFSNVASFDFTHATADEDKLAAKCAWLQSDPASPFLQVLIAQRFADDGINMLLGRVYSRITPAGRMSRTLADLDELEHLARDVFAIPVSLAPLWPAIQAAHERFSGGSATAENP